MPSPNFQLVTEIQTLTRRDFYLADETLLQPFNANPVIDGEWLVINSDYKLARGSGEGTDPTVMPLFTERGRYDTQAIGKASTLFLGMYEAQTKVIDVTALALGDALTVQDVTYQSLTRRGLKKDAAGGGRVRVGYVSKLLDGGYVRFIHQGNQKM